MGNSRKRSGRYGGRAWASVKKGILNDLRQDSQLVVTTMVDFYALPQDWPQRPLAAWATEIEAGMQREIVAAMGSGFNARRFIPFVMMHEFEALLFSYCDLLGSVLHVEPRQLWGIRNRFLSPEEINDSIHTAPSKRIEQILPGYEKPSDAIAAAKEIGLTKMREQCAHFRWWLDELASRPSL